MKYPEAYRRSIRLKGFNYSQSGVYYVTICTFEKECWLGEIIEARFLPTAVGKTVERFWLEIPNHFQHVRLGRFVVMPNHVHGIIEFPRQGVHLNAPTPRSSHKMDQNYFSRISPEKNSLSAIIRTYKASVTTWCRKNQCEYFRWQRNYHEHIIRNEDEYSRISAYIRDNPLAWESDEENPKFIKNIT